MAVLLLCLLVPSAFCFAFAEEKAKAAEAVLPKLDFTVSYSGGTRIDILPISHHVHFEYWDPSVTARKSIREFYASTLSYLVKTTIGGVEYYSYAAVGHRPDILVYSIGENIYFANKKASTLAIGPVRMGLNAKVLGIRNRLLTSTPGEIFAVNLSKSEYGMFGIISGHQIPDGDWLEIGKPRLGKAKLLLAQGEVDVMIVKVKRNFEKIAGQATSTLSIQFKSVDGQDLKLMSGNSGSVLTQNNRVVGVLAGNCPKPGFGLAVHIDDMLESQRVSLQDSFSLLKAIGYVAPGEGMELITQIL